MAQAAGYGVIEICSQQIIFSVGPNGVVLLIALLWHVGDMLTIFCERRFVFRKSICVSRTEVFLSADTLFGRSGKEIISNRTLCALGKKLVLGRMDFLMGRRRLLYGKELVLRRTLFVLSKILLIHIKELHVLSNTILFLSDITTGLCSSFHNN